MCILLARAGRAACNASLAYYKGSDGCGEIFRHVRRSHLIIGIGASAGLGSRRRRSHATSSFHARCGVGISARHGTRAGCWGMNRAAWKRGCTAEDLSRLSSEISYGRACAAGGGVGEDSDGSARVRHDFSTRGYVQVRETFFVPVREEGAVILLEVETEQPLEIEAAFHRDFQLEWPAALGATYLDWARSNTRFIWERSRRNLRRSWVLRRREPRQEYKRTIGVAESSFRLGITAKGKESKLIVIAGSVEGRAARRKRTASDLQWR